MVSPRSSEFGSTPLVVLINLFSYLSIVGIGFVDVV